MRDIKEQIEWFKEQMELKLRENDHKGGWENSRVKWLFDRLDDEAFELYLAIFDKEPPENIIKEAADVANFAMMIADVTRKKMDSEK